MNSFAQLRESLQKHFKMLNGSESGMVTVIGFGEVRIAFYVVLITRRPERYFGTRSVNAMWKWSSGFLYPALRWELPNRFIHIVFPGLRFY